MVPTASHLFRIDKFIVPAAAREDFLAAVRKTQQLIGDQPGCAQNQVLEQVGGPGEFNFVTIVEWESNEAMEDARQVITAMHVQTGTDVQAFRDRQGIRADVATYRHAPDMAAPRTLAA